MLCRVIGCVGDDGVCDGRFSEDGSFQFFGGFVNGDVQVIYIVVPFNFCGK